MSPPLLGLRIGFVYGGLMCILYFYYWQIRESMLFGVLELFSCFTFPEPIYSEFEEFWPSRFFCSAFLIVWYMQYGFWFGVFYWALRKKLKRSRAAAALLTAFVIISGAMYIFNRTFR